MYVYFLVCVCLVLWHFNHYRLSNVKSTFLHIKNSISNNSLQQENIFVYSLLDVKTVLFQTISV